MPEKTITQQLNEVFEKASLSYVRKILTSFDDLERLSEINRNTLERADDLARRFHEEYDSRVEAARQKLYEEAIEVRFDHPAPSGAPATNTDTITLQAHQQVRLAHDADLRATAEDAQRQIEELLEQAQRRNQTQVSVADAFGRAHDRRSGQDRRIHKQSQD